MSARGGFVVGTCISSCQGIIDASQDIVMQVPTRKWRPYPKKKKKKKNWKIKELINR